MRRGVVLCLAATLALTACAPAQTGDDVNTDAEFDRAAVEEEIWAKEAAIFEGRGQGDLTNYLSVTSDSYLGWPPVMAQPLGLENFRESAANSEALEGEVITFEKNGFTMNGNTAVAYFTTHRTRLGKGFAPEGERDVSQFYENTHIWTFENGEWRLIGGMARLLPDPEGRQQPDEL